MKKLTALAAAISISTMALSSAALAQDSVFSCKSSGAEEATILVVSASQALLGDRPLTRDKSYLPGNGGKQYHRFFDESADLLVPTLMTRNRTNQGVIVFYTNGTKTLLSCIK
jgi:hypothetical protein